MFSMWALILNVACRQINVVDKKVRTLVQYLGKVLSYFTEDIFIVSKIIKKCFTFVHVICWLRKLRNSAPDASEILLISSDSALSSFALPYTDAAARTRTHMLLDCVLVNNASLSEVEELHV